MQEDNSIFLTEAINIGNAIVDASVHENNSCFWNVYTHEDKIDPNNISFYGGYSGVITYLIELYKITGQEKYLDTVLLGAEWLIRYSYSWKDKNLAFYCGCGGVIYVFTEIYKLTGVEKYKLHALSLAKNGNPPNSTCDILYGSAGSILTLLHLHNETGEDWLLDTIYIHVNYLLGCTLFPTKGFCWERTGCSIHPLCGFAHGASGIAFVFLELHRYFKIELFYKIAEKAFEYEDQYFHTEGENIAKNNWPDLRKDVYQDDGVEKLVTAYREQDFIQFTNYTFMSAWCHGAPGIGMARLHAYKWFGNGHFLKMAENAIDNTIRTLSQRNTNYTLCHGVFGNLNLLIDAYCVTNNSSFLSTAVNYGKHAIANNNGYTSGISKTGARADANLLNGLAGIGHFYLRLVDPSNIKSVLVPCISQIKTNARLEGRISTSSFLNLMYKNIFPNTCLQLHIEDLFLTTDTKYIERDFIENMVAEHVRKSNDILVHKAYETDILRIQKHDGIESDNYFYIKDIVNNRNLNSIAYDNLSFDEMLHLNLVVDNSLSLQIKEFGNYNIYTILQISPRGQPVVQYEIGEYVFDLIYNIKNNNSLGTVYDIMKGKYLVNNKQSFDTIFMKQLKNCIKSKFIALM